MCHGLGEVFSVLRLRDGDVHAFDLTQLRILEDEVVQAEVAEVCLMGVDGDSTGLFDRDTRRLNLVVYHASNHPFKQLKFLVKESFECLFLNIDHVVAKVGNVVVG